MQSERVGQNRSWEGEGLRRDGLPMARPVSYFYGIIFLIANSNEYVIFKTFQVVTIANQKKF